MSVSVPDDALITCEFCGKEDAAKNFTATQRFCSSTCSAKFSVSKRQEQRKQNMQQVG